MRYLSALFLSLAVVLTTSSLALARDYTPKECPVVGNTNSKIYHVPGGRSYAKMLRQNHSGDNRQCFQSESSAQKAGYRRAKR